MSHELFHEHHRKLAEKEQSEAQGTRSWKWWEWSWVPMLALQSLWEANNRKTMHWTETGRSEPTTRRAIGCRSFMKSPCWFREKRWQFFPCREEEKLMMHRQEQGLKGTERLECSFLVQSVREIVWETQDWSHTKSKDQSNKCDWTHSYVAGSRT